MKWSPLNIEDRVYWKQVKGVDVLFSDFRNSNESEVINLLSLQLDHIVEKPNEMVYGISLVKNTSSFSFIMEESKRNPLVKKNKVITAVVGLNIFQKVKLYLLNQLYSNTLRGFDTTEEALDYLVKMNKQLHHLA